MNRTLATVLAAEAIVALAIFAGMIMILKGIR